MRVAVILAVIIAVIAQLALAQSKSICVPIAINGSTVNPANIPASTISGMSDRGMGSYTASFNLCSPGAINGCNIPAFAGLSNATGCTAAFDKPKKRPTPGKDGFDVSFGSSTSPNDVMDITVRCDASGGAALTSKSRKFATQKPNKQGGTTYMMIVYSRVACASAPPTPAGDSCRPVTILGKKVDPSTWTPQLLTLDVGFTGQFAWWFSPCSNSATPPSWAQTCSPNGYVVEYNPSGICLNVSFDKLQSFRVSRDRIYIQYGSTTNPTWQANLRIGCYMGSSTLSSPSGIFTIVNNTYTFDLGIQDMCGANPPTLPPWTPPPFTPAPGSGSNMPSSGSSNMPSSGSMPSGNSLPSSGSNPSGGSMPSAN